MALISWICGLCGEYNSVTAAEDADACGNCGLLRSQRTASIHAADRVVYNYNPQTGEVRIPGRADRPIDPKYAAAGFERRECSSLSEVRKLEKRTGTISEVGNWDSNGTEIRGTGAIS